jgi:hypothetical protein
MRRKALNRLWTVLITLLLCGATAASLPGRVWADQYPGDPAPPGPPNPGAGDPDWPSQGGRTPKPGPIHGSVTPDVQRPRAATRQDALNALWFKVRMALSAGFRVFFRF